jgi:F-type H+-transporting ATPase subunit b
MKMLQSARINRALTLVTFLMVMLPGSVLASTPEWRPTYDMAMKWVNFIILAAVIIKYARDPIKTFLKQQKGDVVAEIDQLDADKERVIGEIDAARVQAEENKNRLAEMKDRLIAQGEIRKQQIVDQSRQQSAIMIEEARKKMENRILQTKDKLKMELADMAFEQAIHQLPAIINDEDNQRLLGMYMKGMHLDQETLT